MYKIYYDIEQIEEDLIKKFNIHSYHFSKNNYLITINENESLYAYYYNKTLHLDGKVTNVNLLVEILLNHNLEFYSVSGNELLTISFLNEYNILFNGNYYKVDEKYFFEKNNVDSILLSGGCFWCVSKPYYEHDGIIKVFSGFSGGTTFNPTYEATKNQENDHKESILIYYDRSLININQIFDIYLETIDPFDSEGQFIDRGLSYTCAMYYKNTFQKAMIDYKLANIEVKFSKKVAVEIKEDTVFYKADEKHQDYAIKNPKQMKEELISSGRLIE